MTKCLKKLMIVEDEALIAADLEQRLTSLGYAVTGIADTASDAIQEIEDKRPDLLLVDIHIRGPVDGVALAEQIKHQYKLPVIFLTAYADAATLGRAKVTEPFGYLVKPVGTASLPTAIEIALYKHKIEQELKRQRSWLDTTLRSIGDCIVVTGAARRVEYINDAAVHHLHTRREACLGQPLESVLDFRFNGSGLQVEGLLDNAASENAPLSLPAEVHLRTAIGDKFPVEGTISPCLADGQRHGSVVVFRDIAIRQAAERGLREEQKMIAMGRLATAVSEELDEMAWTMEQCSGAAESRMDGMLLVGLRVLTGKAASLNGRLRSLIRQKGSLVERLGVASFIENQLPELCKTLPSNIALTATYGDSGAEVNAGPDQLSQILTDVVANAVEAMPGGGAIVIETLRVESSEGRRFVRIAIRDNGSGPAPERAGNNFEPSFTTYRDGPGNHCATLGLAAVQNTVSMLGGFLSMDTKLGHGATIELSLPEAGADSANAAATLMVVETNAGVRRTLFNLLKTQNYRLLEAEDIPQAVDVAEAYDGAIDLLVLDISAVDLAVQLKKTRPGMKVLFASDGGCLASQLPDASVISKPIQKGELLDRVAKMLS